MVYILGLTVLGTVVRELRGLRHFKCPGGMLSLVRRKAQESGPELRKRADSRYVGVWGTGGTLLVLSGALILTGTRPASAAAYQHI